MILIWIILTVLVVAYVICLIELGRLWRALTRLQLDVSDMEIKGMKRILTFEEARRKKESS